MGGRCEIHLFVYLLSKWCRITRPQNFNVDSMQSILSALFFLMFVKIIIFFFNFVRKYNHTLKNIVAAAHLWLARKMIFCQHAISKSITHIDT